MENGIRRIGKKGMIDKEKVIYGLEIQLDDLQKYTDNDQPLTLTQEQAQEIISLLKEQEPKIGHWILDPDGMGLCIPAWRCSECGNRHYGLPIANDVDETNIYLFAGSKFCPNCGAKMSRE